MGDWGRVGGVAGAGFAAYARVLHPVPVTRLDLSDVDTWGMPRVLVETRWPWAEIASRQGLTMHPLVQFNRLADLHSGVQFADGWQVGQTREGCLDVDLLAGLTGHLRDATATPDDLVAGIWAGWGELSGSASVVYLSDDAGLQAGGRGAGCSGSPSGGVRPRSGPRCVEPCGAGRSCSCPGASVCSSRPRPPSWPTRHGRGARGSGSWQRRPSSARRSSGPQAASGSSRARSTGTARSSPAHVSSSTRSSRTSGSRPTRSTRAVTSPGRVT
ncbi:hypothetical protein B277_06208 [Janibacter hoylei PVAS-1]|uniref:Uncharacterized protein n=1 Tax=Janibacter hoylei PVAS-1 TaxID=1210046 RepID=K1E8K8_9MICO|nr:hypothetical protein B277_06208 [Janibacter hoylei PVAS-1]